MDVRSVLPRNFGGFSKEWPCRTVCCNYFQELGIREVVACELDLVCGLWYP